jgi:hypothetical protein
MTAREAAAKCDLPLSTFLRWCQQGRIVGARLTDKGYHVPKGFKILFPYPQATMRRAVGE